MDADAPQPPGIALFANHLFVHMHIQQKEGVGVGVDGVVDVAEGEGVLDAHLAVAPVAVPPVAVPLVAVAAAHVAVVHVAVVHGAAAGGEVVGARDAPH